MFEERVLNQGDGKNILGEERSRHLTVTSRAASQAPIVFGCVLVAHDFASVATRCLHQP